MWRRHLRRSGNGTQPAWALVLLLVTGMTAAAADFYVSSIEQWRRQEEAALSSDTGWLTIAGLFWLKEGGNTIGAAASSDIVLPAHSAPPLLGVIEHHAGRTVLRYADKTRSPVQLEPDTSGSPTRVRLGALTFWVIRRGDRYGIRLRDTKSRFRREFTGRQWYLVKREYRVTARFIPFPEPRKFKVASVIGVPQEMTSPGYVEFPLRGQTVRLMPAAEGEELWFIFRDATSGKTTYPGGRFLYAAGPRDGKVILDFNKAYNPPCAFTPYATCPLPPRENRLKVAIEAGELNSHHD